jgi:hypothetical protein
MALCAEAKTASAFIRQQRLVQNIAERIMGSKLQPQPTLDVALALPKCANAMHAFAGDGCPNLPCCRCCLQ